MDIEYGTNQKPTVFISYNRASGYDLADTLQIELSTYADVKRDIKDIENWGSISEFMNTIREQDFVVLIITDAFMKSEGCLYEVMQLMKDKNWDQRVMYVVADDAHCIYDSVSQLNYLSYWESKAAELSNKLRNHKLGAISASIDNLKKIELIVLNIGEFMAKVRDSNNPKTEDAITAVIERVKKNNQVTDVSVIKSTEYFEDENRDVREKGNCLWIADEIREGWNFHSDIAWPI
ncbi:MAG: toll/interleukin-1 receptor domain-containing protein, partial [Parasporobacterium sp.]|nr:toll/interleukin-1 receptor domain-containing protein [Parasporobacterium sp.]